MYLSALLPCLLILLKRTRAEIVFEDKFTPLDPILKSDLGLLSVNIPPIFLREKYWLHSLMIDIPCIDNVLHPNVILMTNEMNYSTNAIMTMANKINITLLHAESRERVLGPLRALNQTYTIFVSHLRALRKKYFDLSNDPMSVWGVLQNNRCNFPTNDITMDGFEEAQEASNREKRQLPNLLEPSKHNIINVEGTGHTFIFNHGPGESSRNVHSGQEEAHPINNVTKLSPIGTGYNAEGQIFQKSQFIADPDAEIIVNPCQVSYQNRVKYITCTLQEFRAEHACFEKYLQCSPAQNGRGKRGIFDFVGDIQNKLFGIATDDQLSKLHKIIKDNEATNSKNTQEIYLLRNSTISLSTHVMNSLTNMSKEMYSQLDNLTSSIHLWASGMEANIRRADSNMQELYLTLSIGTSVSTLHSYIQIMTGLFRSMIELESYYKDIEHIITSHQLQSRFATNTYLNKLWKSIDGTLVNGTSLPKHGMKINVLQKSIFQIYTTSQHLIILFRLPIILNPNYMTFWEPRTVPLIRENIAYTVKLDKSVLVINDHRREWAVVNMLDYMLCYMRSDRVCEQLVIWTTFDQPNCHLSIHHAGPHSQSNCFVEQYPLNKDSIPFAIPSDQRTWLMSTSSDKTTGTLICSGYHGLPARTSTIDIPMLGLLQIPKQCMLDMGGRRIHSPMMGVGQSDSHVSEILEDITNISDIDMISNLTIDVPFLTHSHIIKFQPPLRSQDTLFDSNIVEIHNLNKKMRDQNKIFQNDVNKLANQLVTDEQSYNMSLSGISSWFGNLSLPHFIIPVPSLFNILIVIWLACVSVKLYQLQCHRTSAGIAMSLLPDSLLKHQSFAYSIPTNLSVPLIQNSTSCHTNHWASASITMWIPLICLIMMVILHCHLRNTIMHYSRKTAMKVGWVPINKANIQHAGENRLIVGILIKFSSLLGRDLTRREMLIQVATLPGAYQSWYVEKTHEKVKHSVSGKFFRMSKNCKFVINWNNICIKSKDFKELDTCQDMPTNIVVDGEDLISFTKQHLPWYWWYATFETITHISISRNTDNCKLYDYSTSL